MKNGAFPAEAPVHTVGETAFGIDELAAVASSEARVRLSETPEFAARLAQSVRALRAAIERGEPVYGVTTGFGGSCGNRVAPQDIEVLGANLIRYHGCGTGALLPVAETRAAMLCRLLCLARGYSGVTPDLLERLVAFLNLGITPCVPSEGSVGASGDLTPMSYIAAALAGEREVIYQGRRAPAAEALADAGLPPYRFAPKEPLALLNGTSVMTGIASLAVWRGRKLLAAAIQATALAVHGLGGNPGHFHETISNVKPFAGQGRVAARLRDLLATTGAAPRCDDPSALQDPYSLRCAAPRRFSACSPTRWRGSNAGSKSRPTASATTRCSTPRPAPC
jgi:histidine ammonia-lyase